MDITQQPAYTAGYKNIKPIIVKDDRYWNTIPRIAQLILSVPAGLQSNQSFTLTIAGVNYVFDANQWHGNGSTKLTTGTPNLINDFIKYSTIRNNYNIEYKQIITETGNLIYANILTAINSNSGLNISIVTNNFPTNAYIKTIQHTEGVINPDFELNVKSFVQTGESCLQTANLKKYDWYSTIAIESNNTDRLKIYDSIINVTPELIDKNIISIDGNDAVFFAFDGTSVKSKDLQTNRKSISQVYEDEYNVLTFLNTYPDRRTVCVTIKTNYTDTTFDINTQSVVLDYINALQIRCDYQTAPKKTAGKTISYWSVQLHTENGMYDFYTPVYHFVLKTDSKPLRTCIVYKNSYGGYDTFTTTGITTTSTEVQRTIYEQPDKFISILKNTDEKIQLNTGIISIEEKKLLIKELLESTEVYIYDNANNNLLPIVINTTKTELKNNEFIQDLIIELQEK